MDRSAKGDSLSIVGFFGSKTLISAALILLQLGKFG